MAGVQEGGNPLCSSRESGDDASVLLAGSAAALRWKHTLHLVEVEEQINQKAAPGDKCEKGAQAWGEGLLLGRTKVGGLGPG